MILELLGTEFGPKLRTDMVNSLARVLHSAMLPKQTESFYYFFMWPST